MNSQSPWDFEIKQNMQYSWEEYKCIKCKVDNPKLSFTFDNLRFKQIGNQEADCGWKMVRYIPP